MPLCKEGRESIRWATTGYPPPPKGLGVRRRPGRWLAAISLCCCRRNGRGRTERATAGNGATRPKLASPLAKDVEGREGEGGGRQTFRPLSPSSSPPVSLSLSLSLHPFPSKTLMKLESWCSVVDCRGARECSLEYIGKDCIT